MKDIISMSIIMLFSGLLSTMNIWVNDISDIRLSLNDLYMIGLMTGWMLLFIPFYVFLYNNRKCYGYIIYIFN
jgi:hypothetical protein